MNIAKNQKHFHENELIPDIENLRERCVWAGAHTYQRARPKFLFFNPVFQVYTDTFSPIFLSRVLLRQRQWLNQHHQIFARHRSHLRRVEDWPSSDERTQYEKFLSRSACFTGMMFFKGKLLPRDQWEQMLVGNSGKPRKGPSIIWIAHNLARDLQANRMSSPANLAQIKSILMSKEYTEMASVYMRPIV